MNKSLFKMFSVDNDIGFDADGFADAECAGSFH